MDRAALLDLLAAWDPGAAANLAEADRETILDALNDYLDPDGIPLHWKVNVVLARLVA